MSLIDYLKQVPDFRTKPRYPLWVVLLLVIMGTMSGCLGYRALGDFAARHQAVLLDLFELPHKRLPSYSTIRQVMLRINFVAMTQAFNDWASASIVIDDSEAIAMDGKSIRASLRDYDNTYQDFATSQKSVDSFVVLGNQKSSHSPFSSRTLSNAKARLPAGLQLMPLRFWR